MVDVVLNNKPGRFDAAHRDALAKAITKAVFEASMVEQNGVRVLHMRSAEIVDAFCLILAMIASSHRDALNPRDGRLLAEETTKRLFRRIGELKRPGAPQNPFDHVTYDDDPEH
jgi:hypothetical protein